MAQLKPKQIRMYNQGDLIIGDKNGNGSVLPIAQSEGQVPLVKNIGTASAPQFTLAYEMLNGSSVAFDDSVTSLGASNVQDAIVKLKGSLSTALVYTGTVDASDGAFTPALHTPVVKGTYYLVTKAGNAIQTNAGGEPNENLLAGDAIIWNGTFWDVMAHVDTGVQGTAGQIDVTGTQDTGYTVSIDKAYAGQASISTVGTITSGTWQGSLIDLAHGGTGADLSKVADGSVLFKEGSSVASTASTVANGVGFLGYDASAKTFVWRSADDVIGLAKQTVLTTEEFPVVSGKAAAGQIGVATNAAITVSQAPIAGSVSVFVNGAKLNKADFAVSGSTVTLNDASIGYTIEATDVIDVTYQYQVGA